MGKGLRVSREDIFASVLIPGIVATVTIAGEHLRNTMSVRGMARRVENSQIFPCGKLRRAYKVISVAGRQRKWYSAKPQTQDSALLWYKQADLKEDFLFHINLYMNVLVFIDTGFLEVKYLKGGVGHTCWTHQLKMEEKAMPRCQWAPAPLCPYLTIYFPSPCCWSLLAALS